MIIRKIVMLFVVIIMLGAIALTVWQFLPSLTDISFANPEEYFKAPDTESSPDTEGGSETNGSTDTEESSALTVTLSASDGGSVSVPGKDYNKGDTVSLIATAFEGYEFAGWFLGSEEGELVSKEPSYTFTIEENTALYAKFVYIG